MPNITASSGFNALEPHQQQAHRAKIGIRAEAILGQFWRDDATSDAVRALEIEGWMDVLENCSHSEIRAAWTEYQKVGPRSAAGRLAKPDAGALYRLILKARPKPKLVQPQDEEARVPCSPEKAEEILREAGLAGFGVKRFPKVGEGSS
jgi:hypothetical protein